MINWIKRIVVRYLTRKVFVVANKSTSDYYIVSHITDDGYISLLTDSGSHLPISYSIYKRMFGVVDNLDNELIVGVSDGKILLSSGFPVPLSHLNDQAIEDSLDTSW